MILYQKKILAKIFLDESYTKAVLAKINRFKIWSKKAFRVNAHVDKF